jgi:hypothetical protein
LTGASGKLITLTPSDIAFEKATIASLSNAASFSLYYSASTVV